jgi:hypothetical protein
MTNLRRFAFVPVCATDPPDRLATAPPSPRGGPNTSADRSPVGHSFGRPVVGVTSQSSLTALIQWLQASGSIGRGARCGNGDCAPFALCHPAARTAKPQTLTHCPQRPGRRGISRSPRGLPERLRQPRDVDGDPSRFVLRQPLRPPRFDFALSGVDVRERLPVGVEFSRTTPSNPSTPCTPNLSEAISYINRNPELVKSITSFPYIAKSF